MSKLSKILVIIAAILVIVGMVMVIISLSNGALGEQSKVEYVSNSHQVEEEFTSILFDTGTADIIFAVSEDGKCKVDCFEEKDATHKVEVSAGTLKVILVDEREWFEHIGINTETPKITLYLPKNEYSSLSITESTGELVIPSNFKFNSIDISASTGGIKCYSSCNESLKIETSTGSIKLENVSAKTVDLKATTGSITVNSLNCEGDFSLNVSTGKTTLTDVKCKNFTSDGSTGNITLTDVIAETSFNIERSTGSVRFESSDASEIFVKTSTGSVRGTLRSNKIFLTETSTGEIDVPKSTEGGRCEITTSTGDIEIEVKPKSE